MLEVNCRFYLKMNNKKGYVPGKVKITGTPGNKSLEFSYDDAVKMKVTAHQIQRLLIKLVEDNDYRAYTAYNSKKDKTKRRSLFEVDETVERRKEQPL